MKLPTALPECDPRKPIEHMQRDKKNEGGAVTLVLLKRLGEAYLDRSVAGTALLAVPR